MNYDVEWAASAVEQFLSARLRNGEDPEATFQMILKALQARPEVDRTPAWVVLAGIGALVDRKRVRIRVWKRDQESPDDIKIQILPDPASKSAT